MCVLVKKFVLIKHLYILLVQYSFYVNPRRLSEHQFSWSNKRVVDTSIEKAGEMFTFHLGRGADGEWMPLVRSYTRNLYKDVVSGLEAEV